MARKPKVSSARTNNLPTQKKPTLPSKRKRCCITTVKKKRCENKATHFEFQYGMCELHYNQAKIGNMWGNDQQKFPWCEPCKKNWQSWPELPQPIWKESRPFTERQNIYFALGQQEYDSKGKKGTVKKIAKTKLQVAKRANLLWKKDCNKEGKEICQDNQEMYTQEGKKVCSKEKEYSKYLDEIPEESKTGKTRTLAQRIALAKKKCFTKPLKDCTKAQKTWCAKHPAFDLIPKATVILEDYKVKVDFTQVEIIFNQELMDKMTIDLMEPNEEEKFIINPLDILKRGKQHNFSDWNYNLIEFVDLNTPSKWKHEDKVLDIFYDTRDHEWKMWYYPNPKIYRKGKSAKVIYWGPTVELKTIVWMDGDHEIDLSYPDDPEYPFKSFDIFYEPSLGIREPGISNYVFNRVLEVFYSVKAPLDFIRKYIEVTTIIIEENNKIFTFTNNETNKNKLINLHPKDWKLENLFTSSYPTASEEEKLKITEWVKLKKKQIPK